MKRTIAILLAMELLTIACNDVGETGAPGPPGSPGEQGPPGQLGSPGETGADAQLGTYCGASVPTTGDAGGWTGVKALCESACGSQSAYLCAESEVVVSLQQDLLPDGVKLWYASMRQGGNDPYNHTACEGWTKELGPVLSVMTNPAVLSGEIALGYCHGANRLACCDGI